MAHLTSCYLTFPDVAMLGHSNVHVAGEHTAKAEILRSASDRNSP